MSEPNTDLESATQVQAVAEPPVPVEPTALESPPAQEPTPEPISAGATQLQGDLQAIRKAMAGLPEKLAKRVNLPGHLRESEQRMQKVVDKQTKAIIAEISRAVAASGKRVEANVGPRLKALDNRLKTAEKLLKQIQRKLK